VVCAREAGAGVRATVREPNGELPGVVQKFGVRHDGQRWHMFLLIAGQGVWHATGSELTNLVLGARPVVVMEEVPVGVGGFDVVRSERGWELDFIVETTRFTYVLSEALGVMTNEVGAAVCAGWRIESYRVVEGTNLVIVGVSTAVPGGGMPEGSDRATALWMGARERVAEGTVIKRPGRAGRPTYLSRGTEWAGQFLMIVGSFAVFMAVINLVLFHGKRVIQRQPGLHNSVIFFVFLVVMGVCTYLGNRPVGQRTVVQLGGKAAVDEQRRSGLVQGITALVNSVSNAAERQVAVRINLLSGPTRTGRAPVAAEALITHIGVLPAAVRHQLEQGVWGLVVEHLSLRPDRVHVRVALDVWPASYDFLFKAVLVPIGISVFSLITFYMVSAAYRAFKIRSTEAALLMMSACIVMLGQLPLGAWLTGSLPSWLHWLQLPWLAQKLLTVVNSAAYRGVLIGMMIGGFAAGLRIWLGMDESVFSGLEKK
ncbi:MAG: hypothetical protein N2595_06650, partial [bacterium]|nr:hypothetical protein [bacterium]